MPELSDFVPELVCLGVDGLIFLAAYKAYYTASTVIKNLSAAPEIPIDDNIKKTIIEQATCVSGDDMNGAKIVPYAVIRGDVTPMGKMVTSTYPPEQVTGVIQKVVFTEHKRNLSRTGFWLDSERVLHQYTNEAPFCLTKLNEKPWSLSRPNVEIVDWSEAWRIDLDTIYDKFEPNEGGLKHHVLGWVTGDIHKGTQVTETMLTKGSCVTAVGELVSTSTEVKLRPPSDGKPFFIVRSTVASLIKEYEQSKSGCKVLMGLFGGVGIGLIIYIIYKYHKKRSSEEQVAANRRVLNRIIADRDNRQQQASGTATDNQSNNAATNNQPSNTSASGSTVRTDLPSSAGDRIAAPPGNIPERLQCVVCLEAEREVILLNCGHVCVCAPCGNQLCQMNNFCPVCRGPIASVLPAYLS